MDVRGSGGWAGALLVAVGCATARSQPPALASGEHALAAAVDHATIKPEPRPMVGESLLLDIPGFLPAVLWAPAASHEPKPVVVATHGAYDNPESYCPFWQRIVKEAAFVLCTRGRKIHETAFYYPEHFFIDRETSAALDAL